MVSENSSSASGLCSAAASSDVEQERSKNRSFTTCGDDAAPDQADAPTPTTRSTDADEWLFLPSARRGSGSERTALSVSWWWRNHSPAAAVAGSSSFSTPLAERTTAPAVLAVLVAACVMVVLAGVRRRRRRRQEGVGSSDTDNDKSTSAAAAQQCEQRKRDFLRRVGPDYGYSAVAEHAFIDDWRPVELPGLIRPIGYYDEKKKKEQNKASASSSAVLRRVFSSWNNANDDSTPAEDEDEREVYLDYAGAALPTQSQWQQQQQKWAILGNPHSTGPAAARTANAIQQATKRILDHFHAHPAVLHQEDSSNKNNGDTSSAQHPGYEIVFTSGATAALRLVAERFPWSSGCCSCCCSCSSNQKCVGAKNNYNNNNKSLLVYPTAVHTSVVGMRGAALLGGADVCGSRPIQQLLADIREASRRHRDAAGQQSISFLESVWRQSRMMVKDEEEEAEEATTQRQSDCCSCCGCDTRNLLVLPLECNFGGDRFDVQSAMAQLQQVSTRDDRQQQQPQRWFTMLDIAKAASTGPVNLRELDPDFACVSFYKLFGLPTGLGCLFVKRTAVDTLMMGTSSSTSGRADKHDDARLRGYFGGGSVDSILSGRDFAVRRSEPTPLASLQHGTAHFRGIAALLAGFGELDRLGGMAAIRRHTDSLSAELVRRLRQLRHDNGRSAVVIYGDWSTYNEKEASSSYSSSTQQCPGPTVAFNILRADGSFVGYNEVSKLASLNRPPIQLRTGCFCNPGACQLALELTDDDIIRNYRESGHVCGDQIDIVHGRPTGAIRASFGKDSIWEDLDALVSFLGKMFVNSSTGAEGPEHVARWDEGPKQAVVSELYIFPIKSCSAQKVKKWPLYPSNGRLCFDREFALVDSLGTAMRLQAYPQMAFIRPEIDFEARKMIVRAPDQPILELRLDEWCEDWRSSSVVKVCGNRCGGKLWGDYSVSEWFSQCLGVQCWLARYSERGYEPPKTSRIPRPTVVRDTSVAFANEQPLLLISEHAVEILNNVLRSQNQKPVTSRHFRPNIVVRLNCHQATSSMSQHLEDGWQSLQLLNSGTKFDVVGPCARCSMVDVDPSNGGKGKTLRALAEYRRSNGQITFGIFLRGKQILNEAHETVWINEGDLLSCR